MTLVMKRRASLSVESTILSFATWDRGLRGVHGNGIWSGSGTLNMLHNTGIRMFSPHRRVASTSLPSMYLSQGSDDPEQSGDDACIRRFPHR
jgi:hypothetical protein